MLSKVGLQISTSLAYFLVVFESIFEFRTVISFVVVTTSYHCNIVLKTIGKIMDILDFIMIKHTNFI